MMSEISENNWMYFRNSVKAHHANKSKEKIMIFSSDPKPHLMKLNLFLQTSLC